MTRTTARLFGRILLVASACVLLASGALADPLAAGLYPRSFVFESLERSYELLVPDSYDGSPLPLVIDIHGFGSQPSEQHALSGYRQLAQSEGFLVAYPAGISNSWNAGVCCGDAMSLGLDDVGMLKAMAGDLAQVVSVDASRIYATGLSNGGAMTHRLGCEASEFFAALAPLGAPIALFSGCPARPIPLHYSMGLTDTVVSYALAAPTLVHWRTVNGCASAVPDEVLTFGQATCEIYRQCDAGVEIEFCSVVGNDFAGTPFAALAGHILYINPDVALAARGWDLMSKYVTDPPPVLVPEPTPTAAALTTFAVLAGLGLRGLRRSSQVPRVDVSTESRAH